MKTPITYYGGKQLMVPKILPMIPVHHTYIEPFAGGASILFAKAISESEVLNDTNEYVVAFWRQMQSNFDELNTQIQTIAHSRTLYKRALHIYKQKIVTSELEKAVVLWTLTNQGFGGQIGSWSFGLKDSKKPKSLSNKRINFPNYKNKIHNCIIEQIDAIKCIEKYDNENAFFYIDPPYYNANMGHYGGYLQSDFINLITCIQNIKGKFILSCYPNEVIDQYRNKWGRQDCIMTNFNSPQIGKKKTEVLTYNYKLAI